ncbi:hypothetical protein ACROYT_G002935 [Oculina patagonica]
MLILHGNAQKYYVVESPTFQQSQATPHQPRPQGAFPFRAGGWGRDFTVVGGVSIAICSLHIYQPGLPEIACVAGVQRERRSGVPARGTTNYNTGGLLPVGHALTLRRMRGIVLLTTCVNGQKMQAIKKGSMPQEVENRAN